MPDARLLITTALEETWRSDTPGLFLGEWCRRYSRRAKWQAMDAELLPYHWDDRRKLHDDYRDLRGFQDRLLHDLTGQLNDLHRVDHGLRYWRIVLGPWLGHFVPMLFDRWTSIQQALAACDLTGTIVLAGREASLVPNDMKQFGGMYEADAWNHQLYADVIQRFTSIPCEHRPWPAGVEASTAPVPLTGAQRLKLALVDGYWRTAARLTRKHDAFLLSTYLPFKDEIALNFRLGQVPQLWQRVPAVRVPVDPARREWTVSGESRSAFEACARTLIPRHLPAVHLEGYPRLIEQTNALPWPKAPRVIWTSNADNSDDVFKVYAAEKVERGSAFVMGQHGGNFGIGRWNFFEDHQVGISDRYLTWGWTDPDDARVTPVGQLKAKRPLGVRHGDQPGALLVTCTLPRQSYYMYSVMVSRQWLDYFHDQGRLIDALPERVRRALTVRLYAQDMGWDQRERWTDRFPDITLDDGRVHIEQLIRGSRLYIATYNAATYLESFTMDVPTVMHWNEAHWEIRESAEPYFDALKAAGVMHATPESAARHVAAVWDDVEGWWRSDGVRRAVDQFRDRYCRLCDDLLDRLETHLRECEHASRNQGMRRADHHPARG